MSLISCPDCERRVSRNAGACPYCGAPIRIEVSKIVVMTLACVVAAAVLLPFLVVVVASWFE
jgi:uncharacterized paraquat-inducible protein A